MLNWLPENIATFGAEIDKLFYVIYYLTTAIFFGVFITMIVFLVKYRHREGHKATYYHGNNSLEVIWTVIPAIIVIALGISSASTWNRIKKDIPMGDFQYKVVAKQFNWDMVYPGPDGILDTDDDITLLNDLTVPVNSDIRINLSATDVIHSFFVPNLRLKQDAMPGQEIGMWFNATKPGKYEIACAELCGIGHYSMKGYLTVLEPDEYAQWLKEQS